MSQPSDDIPVTAQEPTRRSRWQRFSPSMGWRAFWSEILIVVIGVVIALAANEAVEQWNWRNKVADGEARLREDTANVFEWSAERYATGPCIDAQLAALITRVMDSGERLDPAPIHTSLNMRRVLTAPQRPFRFPVWDALVADGTASRMSPERQALYGRLGDSMARMRLRNEDYMRLRGRLLVLAHPIALDAQTQIRLLTDLEELRAMNAADVRSLGQDMSFMTEYGIHPGSKSVVEFLATSTTIKFCREQGLPMSDWRDTRDTMIGGGGALDPSAPK
jgi:hypothetical protein